MSSLHYCVWDLCKPWEYCCDENTCCKETDFNLLLLTLTVLGTLILVALILVALCCVCIYCSSQRTYIPFLKRYLKTSYMMSTKSEIKVDSTMSTETKTNAL